MVCHSKSNFQHNENTMLGTSLEVQSYIHLLRNKSHFHEVHSQASGLE